MYQYLIKFVHKDHNTRTIVYQHQTGKIIISRGSDSNIDVGSGDVTSGRGQIRRFAINGTLRQNWLDGELLSWGMRNGVGLSLSQDGSLLWEVENSADDISYQDMDIHEVST